MSNIDDELFKRMVLGNQFEILSLIDKDNTDHYAKAARLVREYYPLDEVPSVDLIRAYAKEPFTERDRTFVYDVLSMFEALQRLGEKGYVPPEPFSLDFPGFSGNEETRFMGYVRYLFEDQRKYTYLKTSGSGGVNSHFPVIDMYERMLEVWRSFGKTRELTPEQANAILEARVHPENRK